MSTVKLTQVVEVDAARLDTLTPEAFRLVLEERGWWQVSRLSRWEHCGTNVVLGLTEPMLMLRTLGIVHHDGSTFDAFAEVERVQALLSAVEAAERGGWVDYADGQRPVMVCAGLKDVDAPSAAIHADGRVVVVGAFTEHMHERLWANGDDSPKRAAREARAQLPRLVRTICGLEGNR